MAINNLTELMNAQAALELQRIRQNQDPAYQQEQTLRRGALGASLGLLDGMINNQGTGKSLLAGLAGGMQGYGQAQDYFKSADYMGKGGISNLMEMQAKYKALQDQQTLSNIISQYTVAGQAITPDQFAKIETDALRAGVGGGLLQDWRANAGLYNSAFAGDIAGSKKQAELDAEIAALPEKNRLELEKKAREEGITTAALLQREKDKQAVNPTMIDLDVTLADGSSGTVQAFRNPAGMFETADGRLFNEQGMNVGGAKKNIVNDPATEAAAKARGEEYKRQLASRNEETAKARNIAQKSRLLGDIADSPDFSSGVIQQRFLKPLYELAESLRINVDGLDAMQVFESVAGPMAMALHPGGPMTDPDLQFYLSLVPNLGNTPDAIKAKIAIAEANAERTQSYNEAYKAYTKDRDGDDLGFDDWYKEKYADDVAEFDATLKNSLEAIGVFRDSRPSPQQQERNEGTPTGNVQSFTTSGGHNYSVRTR